MALNPLDARSLLTSLGALGVFLVLFAETGLLVGFFLPGDSLLFTAGLSCATGAATTLHLSLPAVLAAAAGGALLGAQVGYYIGRRIGPALLDRPTARACTTACSGPGQPSIATAPARRSCWPGSFPSCGRC
jgi:membrane-associated protein